MITRTIRCDIAGCKALGIENTEGGGWDGWGALHGIALNGQPNPTLCPEHLQQVAAYIDDLDKGGTL